LRYACGGKEDVALRAKFSTLTNEDLKIAFANAKIGLGRGLAEAGRTRHVVDFMWGINLSRILSDSFNVNNRYRTVSTGRVQGPTLAFVVEREVEIRTFVPTPYWTVRGVFAKDGVRIIVPYGSRIMRQADVDKMQKDCEGMEVRVSEVKKTHFKEAPPPPFNIGDLQKEAFRLFGYSPSRTAQVAERLYLDALISYPRTDSQKIPPSINYAGILRNLGKLDEYSDYVNELLERKLVPHQGDKDDPAHPAIHPTGEMPRRTLQGWEKRLFDLIVRRFLANFSEDAVFERVVAKINVGKYEFRLSGRRTLRAGWMRYYKHAAVRDTPVPELDEGDLLKVLKIEREENFEAPPFRFNQSSLLEKMEKEGIGTKATRAEIINTLIKRGYLSGTSLEATDFGFATTEVMEAYSPQVLSTHLTKEMEKKLESVELGSDDGKKSIEETIDSLFEIITAMKPYQMEIGKQLNESLIATTLALNVIGNCPVCGTGKLKIIRSAKTHKRFVGCTNYPESCRASAPLPQRGIIKSYSKICEYCKWPVVYVITRRRRPWKLCVNPNCESKRAKKYEMQTVSERS
jgi:DNA topoisomerase-1